MRSVRCLTCFLFLGLASLAAFASSGASPRALSEVERQAVALALDYISFGPEAWWETLSEDAPLRGLDRQDGLREIEVRLGPKQGARWRLQTVSPKLADRFAAFSVEYPSGMEESLLVELQNFPGAGWRLVSLRTLSEPTPEPVPVGEAPAAIGPSTTRGPGAESNAPIPWALLALLAIGLLLLGLAGRKLRGPFPAGREFAKANGLGYLLLLVTVSSAILSCSKAQAPEPQAAVEEEGKVESLLRLGALLPLRRSLALDEVWQDGAKNTGLEAESPLAQRIARIWRAQRALLSNDLATCETLLGKPIFGEPLPLVHLLRGRAQLIRGQDVETSLAYRKLLETDFDHDGITLEAAQNLLFSGYEQQARRALEAAVEYGSREAYVYYTLASFAVYDNRFDRASELFLTAWHLRPIVRSDVFSTTAFSALLDRPEVRAVLHLDSPLEPIPLRLDDKVRPIDLPAGTSAQLLGSLLRLDIQDFELQIPGGSTLALPSTISVDAGEWLHAEEQQALTALDGTRMAAQKRGNLSQPQLLKQVETAAVALARRRRWADLTELTAGLEHPDSILPPGLTRLRAASLHHQGREEEARRLLISLAKDNLEAGRKDPDTFFQLADLFASSGDYDLALKLAAKGNQQSPLFASDLRIDRLRMDRRLAQSYRVHQSRHFEIRYPRDRSPFLAERLAGLLELERKRLLPWIPTTSTERTEVHLLPFQEFMRTFSGGIEVLGLFDGRIRVPMADLPSFHPQVVAILSHELAHAMIAQATDDSAPNWLHEGLAGVMEMQATEINSMPDYHRTSGLLSLPVLQGVLAGFAHPKLVAQSYDQAAWTVRYIANVYGAAHIRRLLAAFKDGKTTEEAIDETFGLPMPAFDTAMRRWWLERAPKAVHSPVRVYRLNPDNSISLAR
ncbi:MAG: hypothetical protein K0U98_22435 [Deltaproteobacteria bacterium]|nr:hypothetical protein [Deltaproteobacteria bacterium]